MIGAHPQLVDVAAGRPRPAGQAGYEAALIVADRGRHQAPIIHAGSLRVVLVEPCVKLVGEARLGIVGSSVAWGLDPTGRISFTFSSPA